MRPRIYNPNTRHSNEYYHSVLNLLIAGNRDNLTYLQIAGSMNAQDIKTSSGLLWTAENVKAVLRKLRLYKEFPSKIHHALLELVFDNQLELRDTLPLFQSRPHEAM